MQKNISARVGPTGGGFIERGEDRLRLAILSEFVHPFHKGGAERRYYEIGSRLARRGHEIHWFAMRHWPERGDSELSGIRLHPVSEPFDVYAAGGGRAIGAGLRLGLSLTGALKRSPHSFDVIDCSLYPFFHIFGARAVRPRTPLVVSWYEYWGDHWYEYLGWKGFFGKQVERLAAAVPARIISVSDLTSSSLRSAGVPADRVVGVPLGVDSRWIESIAPAPERSDVVFFGRLKNHKNVDLLLRALVEVKRELADVRAAIVGDGPERQRLERLTSELGLGSTVRFYGELTDEEVIATVKASRLFVHPSTKEGGGSITLVEANAAGTPAIAIDHPLGLDKSLIEEGRNGWWAPSADPRSLAVTISRALTSPNLDALRRSAAAYGRSLDWDRIAIACERVYLETASATKSFVAERRRVSGTSR